MARFSSARLLLAGWLAFAVPGAVPGGVPAAGAQNADAQSAVATGTKALAGDHGPKFSLAGTTLIYDTDRAEAEIDQEIVWEDSEALLALLLGNPEIEIIQLNSIGGLVDAARYMADIIIDFEKDTHVVGECSSACVPLFLAGNRRTIQRGSWLGFHQSYWDAADMEAYYDDLREDEGWLTPFDFASWVVEDTQQSVVATMEFMIERGVRPSFVVKVLQATSDDMWYPRRAELEEAGVIRE